MVTYNGSVVSILSKQFRVTERDTDIQQMIMDTVNKIKADNEKDAHIDLKNVETTNYSEITEYTHIKNTVNQYITVTIFYTIDEENSTQPTVF